ncbi:1,2-phenylacetyl-CoA epoxidase subunit PaaE [Actinocatenispora rupis]|uniref:Phenylacetic acid degradation protein n=1 Tax=Actinocatenispora rupis TaxID=519421 RepID=A0A8J3NDT5_9ACTN|nr:1,2-phenylacetyl-CoA epoxidase subunit PaaE [Actinocatenispora rupis]GID15634.1 phenylacetic acid degradation protein [Actinocatenispora rupis]
MPTVTVRRPQRRRPEFHKLPVTAIDRLTDDAYALTFGVPDELRETFRFRAGQHLTLRHADGADVRRSYSICSTPAELAETGALRVGVRLIPGGAFSAYVADGLAEGDRIEVMPPLGHFTTDLDPLRRKHYAAIVAGSGITPVLSLVATALAIEPHSRFTLLYGNRDSRSVMFAEELADLKDRYPARLHLVHVLSREPQDAELLSGRLDPDRLRRVLPALVPPSTVDEWFLCGPYGMVVGAQHVLAESGVADGAVHTELFHVAEEPPPPPSAPPETGGSEVTIRLDGRASTFRMRYDERILDRAMEVRSELPYSCRGGVCSTCRARVVDGEVRMARNFALEPDELAAGYVLTCQSSPVTEQVTVDYDG